MLFGLGQRRRLENDLDGNALHGAHDGFDIGGHHGRLAALERAEIHHHVDLARAFAGRDRGCSRFHFGVVAAVRKADHADEARIGAGECLRGRRDPAWLHAIETDVPGANDVGACADFTSGRLGLEHRVIDHAGEVGARHGALAPGARMRAMRSVR